MTNALYVLNTLAPLLALVSLGLVLRRIGFFNAGNIRDVNRLLYWVALPALLFNETAQARIQGDAVLRVFLALFLATLSITGVGYLLGTLLRVPRSALGAFVQGGLRGNLGYVALPVMLLAFTTQNGSVPPALKALAVLAVGTMTPIYNLLAVFVLLGARPADADAQVRQRLRRILFAIATNPLVIACGAGLLVALFGWPLPAVLSRTLSTLGQMSTPLALLGIGGSLTLTVLRHNLRLASVAALVKLAIAPLVGFGIAALLGLSPTERLITLICLASPTAAASNVMAEQLGSDEKLAASIIVLTTLLSVFSLAGSLFAR